MRSQFRYGLIIGALILAILGFTARYSYAQSPATAQAPTATLFENVRIFNGTADQLSTPANVLVVGNKIEQISANAIPAPADVSMTRINGNGRTLMPGLIDAHVHLFMAALSPEDLLSRDTPVEKFFKTAETTATGMLMRGFTSVRDLAGPVFDLKKAIDAGTVAGPRIWPSGAMISQTSGHGDFRALSELPRTPTSPLNRGEALGAGAIADGVDEVLRATREQLMRGASQIKLAAGGGVSSNYDPLDVSQYTEAELHAAVEAAANWNTYVTVHAYTPTAIQTAIRAGVKCIDHGQLMDDETAQIMAENDIWLSMQPFIETGTSVFPEGSPNRIKQLQLYEGTDTAYGLAKKYNLKTAWGTDQLWSAEQLPKQGEMLSRMVRWYTPAEVLKMATSINAELLALSGPRSPYPGKLGVVEEGALADLLLVNGNPLEDIQLVADATTNFIVIMKDGKIYKNTAR
ncbi:MAG: amidohydrolase family protein [Nodosilinea sp.]